jgi:hypothetical protein
MPTCTLRAPEGWDSTPTKGHSRPILFVKYHEVILGYAAFRSGEYHFEAAESTCAAIDDGTLTVSFQFDEDMVPIGIILTDNFTHPEQVSENPD